MAADTVPTEEDRVPIGDAVSFAWATFKNNWGFYVVAALILGLIGGLASGPMSFPAYWRGAGGIIFMLLFIIISILVGTGIELVWVNIGLKATKGEKAGVDDMVANFDRYWDFLIASILYGLQVIAGLILLIVPGIYWAIKYHFYGYLIVDQGMKPVEVIKKSGEITYGAKWMLLVFGLVCMGIYIIGFICCCVGVLAAMPIIFISIAYIYRVLLGSEPPARQEDLPPLPPQEPAQ